jgi:hypothetical protein
MRHVLFAGLFALSACGPQPALIDQAAVKSEVTAMVQGWATSGGEGRWDDIPGYISWGPGVVWIEQGRIAYQDREALLKGVAQAKASGLPVTTTVSDLVITPLKPDVAVLHARTKIVFGSPPESGFVFDGVMTATAVKQDGRWGFLQAHLSEPHRVPPPAPAP